MAIIKLRPVANLFLAAMLSLPAFARNAGGKSSEHLEAAASTEAAAFTAVANAKRFKTCGARQPVKKNS